MNSRLSQIFKETAETQPSKSLESVILRCIEAEKDRRMKRNFFLSYASFAASAIGTFYAFAVLGNSFARSEFWSMISLMFSDAIIVAGNWNEYLYSLLETFPVMNAILVLIPIFALLLSLNFYLSLKNKMKRVHHLGNLKFKSV